MHDLLLAGPAFYSSAGTVEVASLVGALAGEVVDLHGEDEICRFGESRFARAMAWQVASPREVLAWRTPAEVFESVRPKP